MLQKHDTARNIIDLAASSRMILGARRYVLKNIPLIDQEALRFVATAKGIYTVEPAFARWARYHNAMIQAEMSGTGVKGAPDPMWEASSHEVREGVVVVNAMLNRDAPFMRENIARDKQEALYDLPRTLRIYKGIRDTFSVYGVPRHTADYRAARCAIEAAKRHVECDDAIQEVVDSFVAARALREDGHALKALVESRIPEWMYWHVIGMFRDWRDRRCPDEVD